MSRAVAKQGQKLAEQGAKAGDDLAEMKPASVTAYGSGNAAQVYFDLFPRKITLSELNSAYPNMVDALVQHEGIGMVVGYADDMTPVALGKGGQRNLHTGEVIGVDPVAPYAKAEGHGAGTHRDAGLAVEAGHGLPPCRRPVADQHGLSRWHSGGAGGARSATMAAWAGSRPTPSSSIRTDMEVTETRNSTDVFHILNNHRGKPVAEKPPVAAEETGRRLGAQEPAQGAWPGRRHGSAMPCAA